jgi:hypothetical protein
VKFRRASGIVFTLAVALVVGCAVGDESEVGLGDEDAGLGAVVPTGAAAAPPATAAPGTPTGEPRATDASMTNSGMTDAGMTTLSDSGSRDASSMADGGGSNGDGGAPPVGSTDKCAQTGSCPGSVVPIGRISGDTDSASITKAGSGSGFFSVYVTEDDSGFLSARPLNTRYTLKSPVGANYELRLYYDPSNSSVTAMSCAPKEAATSSASTTKVLSVSWEDTQGLGGIDNDSNVTIEVRFVSGTCVPGEQWQLLVEGNK